MRPRPPWRIPATASTASLVCALFTGLTGCGSDLYIVSEQAELVADERLPRGGGCTMVGQRSGLFAGGASSSSGGSTDSDLMVEEGEKGERYVVEVRSFGEVLAHRAYNRAFLKAHKVDTFEVTTSRGKRFEFTYRGSDDCDLPSPQSLPQDAGSATRRD